MDKDMKRKQWSDSLNFEIPEVDVAAFPIASPISTGEMNWVSRRWTVCQILRELYHAVDDPKLKLKCRIASRMTKEMASTIIAFDPNWSSGRWPWREKQDK